MLGVGTCRLAACEPMLSIVGEVRVTGTTPPVDLELFSYGLPSDTELSRGIRRSKSRAASI